jgi:uncharacterized protein
MSSTNQGPEYFEAEKKYLVAGDAEERIFWLQEMIRHFKKHKGSEKMQAELKNRLRKLKEALAKSKKSGKGKKGIRKEGFQVALVGKTNSGKSLLLGKLTNARSKVSVHEFTTKEAELGTMHFEGVKAQIVDLPSVGSKDYDKSVMNSADCLLIVVDDLGNLEEIEDGLKKARGKKIIVVNKLDRYDFNGRRKIEATCKSKRLNCVIVSASTGEGVENLKKKIFGEMDVIRVFTKEPGKPKNNDPVVMSEGSNVRDVAETIFKGFSRTVKETRLTGPSGKFSNQRVGMKHVCKDMDVVEFRT